MSKRAITTLISVAAILVCLFGFVGCGRSGNKSKGAAKEYTIMYSYDGTKELTVKHGDLYSIDPPNKYGYDFVGLFDSAVGGVQYIGSDGVCLAPFTDDINIVLYPQFTGKPLTVVFHDGDNVKEATFFKYGDKLSSVFATAGRFYEEKPHKIFDGWVSGSIYSSGEKVMDGQGVALCVLDGKLLGRDFTLDLYATFKTETFVITFKRRTGETIVEKSVEYGAELKSIVKSVRDRGVPVAYWTATDMSNDPIDFTGVTATGETEYYVGEYSPTEIKGTYTNSDRFDIGTKQLYNNPADTVSIEAVCGSTVAEMIEAGYTKVKFKLVLSISEKDDGYQEFFFCRSRRGGDSNIIWFNKYIEHTRGKTDKSTWDHTFESPELDASAVADTMYILYSAHGSGANGWIRWKAVLDITFCVDKNY